MTRIETYRLFGLCVALASGAAMLQGCSDNNAGTGTTGGGGSTGTTTGSTGTGTTGTGTTGTGTTTGSTTSTGTGGGSKAVTYCSPAYPAPLPVTSALISDFDSDASPLLVQAIMPGGVWAVDTDGVGTPPKEMAMTVGSCGTTGNGIHFTGMGHTGWGADVAAAVVSQLQPVDVSMYSGISFVMKPAANTNLIFKVQNPYSQPPCGVCTDQVVGGPPPPLGTECYPGFTKNFSLVANDATPLVVKWGDLMQQGWGYHPPGVVAFDPNNLVSIAFAFDTNVNFDVCLDDVKFLP